MALLQVNFVSQALMRTVPIQVILPVDKCVPGQPPRTAPYPTLYLLHGMLGNYTDWVSGTRIQRWAEAHDLAVVMPSGDNRFYVDQPATHDLYGAFIGRELVEMTRRMFPLSHRRQDTFIGGLSMGGYGALRGGLCYPETFGAIAALSSANIPAMLDSCSDDAPQFFQQKRYLEALFGPLDRIAGSDKDPLALADRLPADARPRLYLACGLQDPLLPLNRALAAGLQDRGLAVTYREAPGDHEWDFWDSQIRCVVDWLLPQGGTDGLGSGNVGL